MLRGRTYVQGEHRNTGPRPFDAFCPFREEAFKWEHPPTAVRFFPGGVGVYKNVIAPSGEAGDGTFAPDATSAPMR